MLGSWRIIHALFVEPDVHGLDKPSASGGDELNLGAEGLNCLDSAAKHMHFEADQQDDRDDVTGGTHKIRLEDHLIPFEHDQFIKPCFCLACPVAIVGELGELAFGDGTVPRACGFNKTRKGDG